MPTSKTVGQGGTSITGYVRRPKSERKPPDYAFKITHQPFEEAVLDVALSGRQIDVGYGVTNENYRTALVEENLAFFIAERSVTMTESQRVIRYNRRAQKPYAVNEVTSVRTIFLTSRDNIHFYFYDIIIDSAGKKKRIMVDPLGSEYLMRHSYRVWTVAMNNGMTPMLMLRSLAEKYLGKPVDVDHVYPMREYLGGVGNEALDGNLMRCTNPQDFTREAFGKRLYRKDLVKAMSRTVLQKQFYYPGDNDRRVYKLVWLMAFKNLVPIDWIIQAAYNRDAFLMLPNEAIISVDDKRTLKGLREILEHLKPAERKNILENGTSINTIADVIRIWNYRYDGDLMGPTLIDARERNFTSFRELHDHIARQYGEYTAARRKADEIDRYTPDKMWVNQEDACAGLAWALEHMINGPFHVKVARDYETLHGWSAYMNNCISSYFHSRRTILVGIYEGGVPIANAEIVQGEFHLGKIGQYEFRLKQLLGKHNARLEADLRGTIEGYFKQFGITTDKGVWW